MALTVSSDTLCLDTNIDVDGAFSVTTKWNNYSEVHLGQ